MPVFGAEPPIGSQTFKPPVNGTEDGIFPGIEGSFMQYEDGFFMLFEDGFKMKYENSA